MILLVSLASAGSANGFTTPGALASHSATLQVAGLFDADRAYGQGTVIVNTHWHNLGFDAELTGLAGTGTTNWSDAGFGSFRIGVRAFFGSPGFANALGVDLRAGIEGERVSFWVVRSADAITYYTPRLTWDLTLGPLEAPFSVRVTVGYAAAQSGLVAEAIVVGAGSGISVSKVFSVAERWGVLTEGELIVDGTPFSLRTGARFRPNDHWSVDALLSVPLYLFVTHPVSLPAVQVRGEL